MTKETGKEEERRNIARRRTLGENVREKTKTETSGY